MINTLDAEDIKDRIQDRLWKHDGYFGYADAMKIVEEEIDKSICKHCSQNTRNRNEVKK